MDIGFHFAWTYTVPRTETAGGCVICKYFLPFVGCLFTFFIICITKVFNFDHLFFL